MFLSPISHDPSRCLLSESIGLRRTSSVIVGQQPWQSRPLILRHFGKVIQEADNHLKCRQTDFEDGIIIQVMECNLFYQLFQFQRIPVINLNDSFGTQGLNLVLQYIDIVQTYVHTYCTYSCSDLYNLYSIFMFIRAIYARLCISVC